MDPAKLISTSTMVADEQLIHSAGEESEHILRFFSNPLSSAAKNYAGNLIPCLCVRLICDHSWEFNYLHPVTIHFRSAFIFLEFSLYVEHDKKLSHHQSCRIRIKYQLLLEEINSC